MTTAPFDTKYVARFRELFAQPNGTVELALRQVCTEARRDERERCAALVTVAAEDAMTMYSPVILGVEPAKALQAAARVLRHSDDEPYIAPREKPCK